MCCRSKWIGTNNKIFEKNNLKLNYILNTHHHYDHVGGNLELKKRYSSYIIGFKGDKDRIPEVDVLVENNQIWKKDNFEAKIYHIPGHTTGHIAYHFFKEKKIFTGDTLFSLGCGRIFEGTYEQMFNSLEKIKKLPKNTIMYCGHEYTNNNGKFCLGIDRENIKLKNRVEIVKKSMKKNLPTIPITLGEELETNIFLRCDDKKIKNNLKMDNGSKLEVFTKLRSLKDRF